MLLLLLLLPVLADDDDDTSTAPRRNNGFVQPQNAPTITIDIISQPRFNIDDDADDDCGGGDDMVIVSARLLYRRCSCRCYTFVVVSFDDSIVQVLLRQ